MNNNHIEAFKDCYKMQPDDIWRFAMTLADGFSQYDLFKCICGKEYNHEKMQLFWAVSLAILPENAICVADCKQVNSVLIYLRPQSKETNPISYIKAGGLKMLVKLGVGSIIRLLRFDAVAQRVAKRYKTANDGYLMAFATRIDKQGQGYGKPLIEALLSYLCVSGEGCYLETLKATNVDLYEHFSFQLKETTALRFGNLRLYALHRAAGE
jgi:hypothetical protein